MMYKSENLFNKDRVMIIALGERSLLDICTVIQLLETSINRRLMSVLRVRVSFDVMCLFLDLACVCS